MSDEDVAARPRTIGRNGLATQACEALREQILDQTITPGARINIDQVVADLGVSSSPIREALARLLSEHLVTFAPYIGYSAAPIPDDAWFDDMIEFRATLEGQAATLGAPRRDPRTITALESAFAEMGASGLGHHYRKYRRFNAADADFHRAVVASAGNRVFLQVYTDIQPHVHYARLYLSRGVEEEADVANQHGAILDAFRDGDGERARSAITTHLESVRTHLLKNAARVRGRNSDSARPKKR